MQNLWLKAENIIKSRVTHVAAHRSVILFYSSPPALETVVGPAGHQTYRALVIINPPPAPPAAILPNPCH